MKVAVAPRILGGRGWQRSRNVSASMLKPTPPVSLADLSAAGIRLRPYEAATIVRALALAVARGDLAGIPSSHVIRLSVSGDISVEGPVGAGGPSVALGAQLLESLLPPAEAGGQFRVPGGLRLVVARALGAVDLPPFTSLEAFAEALSRFAADDPAGMVRNLVAAWSESAGTRIPQASPAQPLSRTALAPVEPFVTPRSNDHSQASELTVSDIRRARRATGLTLAQVAKRSRVPLTLLRQLEWGYLANWPSGHYGRRMLLAYARAVGLDHELVRSVLAPLMLEAERRRAALVQTEVAGEVAELLEVDEPLVDIEVVRVADGTSPRQTPMRSRSTAVLAALAIPALLFIAIAPAWWAASSRPNDIVTRIQSAVHRAERADRPEIPAPSANRRSSSEQADARDQPTVEAVRSGSSEEGRTAAETRAGAVRGRAVTRPANASATDTGDESGDGWPLVSVGTAMFYPPDDDEQATVVPANARGRDSVLRITRIVDDSASNLHLRVSHDGGKIAFDSDRDGVRGVFVADRDGKNVRRVSGDGFAALPSWSPDGRTLAFVRADRSRPSVWNLWTADLATGELTQITQHTSGQPRGAAWFPDGTRLAYAHLDRLIVREVGTGAERVFTSPRRGRRLGSPAVSPDGRRVIFHVARDGAWMLELSGASMRRVLEDPTAEEFTWSPDGSRVAYHSTRVGGWGVWVMAPR